MPSGDQEKHARGEISLDNEVIKLWLAMITEIRMYVLQVFRRQKLALDVDNDNLVSRKPIVCIDHMRGDPSTNYNHK
jgi:hypothetical protein